MNGTAVYLLNGGGRVYYDHIRHRNFFFNSLWEFFLVFLYFIVCQHFFDCDLIFEAEGISYIIRIWVFTVGCEEVETKPGLLFFLS